jgi:hypothetical protein
MATRFGLADDKLFVKRHCTLLKMPKRKQGDEEDQGGSESDTLTDFQGRIQLDFEFFDPNPGVDFIALKRLITQLFQADADLLQPHELSELILSQPLVGTTVKTDGKESDPYAFLTVLNIHVHKVFFYLKLSIDQVVSNNLHSRRTHQSRPSWITFSPSLLPTQPYTTHSGLSLLQMQHLTLALFLASVL